MNPEWCFISSSHSSRLTVIAHILSSPLSPFRLVGTSVGAGSVGDDVGLCVGSFVGVSVGCGAVGASVGGTTGAGDGGRVSSSLHHAVAAPPDAAHASGVLAHDTHVAAPPEDHFSPQKPLPDSSHAAQRTGFEYQGPRYGGAGTPGGLSYLSGSATCRNASIADRKLLNRLSKACTAPAPGQNVAGQPRFTRPLVLSTKSRPDGGFSNMARPSRSSACWKSKLYAATLLYGWTSKSQKSIPESHLNSCGPLQISPGSSQRLRSRYGKSPLDSFWALPSPS
mmetsp:Transcript_22269/g.63130  ORF Transcript_22269/g.63130 Transcript_22269/m.63130 type:complete len:281 (-) Transcript_22269:1086-1928(-)